jgi:hypothetical protein
MKRLYVLYRPALSDSAARSSCCCCQILLLTSPAAVWFCCQGKLLSDSAVRASCRQILLSADVRLCWQLLSYSDVRASWRQFLLRGPAPSTVKINVVRFCCQPLSHIAVRPPTAVRISCQVQLPSDSAARAICFQVLLSVSTTCYKILPSGQVAVTASCCQI